MGDGMIGQSHVAIPDLLEPVVGFRTFTVVGGTPAKEAWDQEVWSNNPAGDPFVEPNEFVTDPATGKLIKNYKKIAEAFEKWQASLGTMKIVHHEAEPATKATLASPTKKTHRWVPGQNEATCLRGPIQVAMNPEDAPWHKVPYGSCECGYYSYYEAKNTAPGGMTLLGIVTSWGRIEAHPTGMRSQYMEIHALWGGDAMKLLGPEWNDVLKFWVGEVDVKEFASLATEFGSPMPEGMRPKLSEEEMLVSQYPTVRLRYPPRLQPIYPSSYYDESKMIQWEKVVGRVMFWGGLLLCCTVGLWAPLFAASGSPAHDPSTPHIRQYNPPRNVFKDPLSVPANSLVRPIGADDG